MRLVATSTVRDGTIAASSWSSFPTGPFGACGCTERLGLRGGADLALVAPLRHLWVFASGTFNGAHLRIAGRIEPPQRLLRAPVPVATVTLAMNVSLPARAASQIGIPSPDSAISARALVKRFGDLRAVDGIDLDVPRGMIFAILGPNGAGKTTLMRMLATLLHPDAGAATVMGHDLTSAPDKVRGEIAMTGQFASLDEDLTGRENLMLLARLWGFRGKSARERADQLLGTPRACST